MAVAGHRPQYIGDSDVISPTQEGGSGGSLLNLTLPLLTTIASDPSERIPPDYVCDLNSHPDVELSRKVFLWVSMVFVLIGLITNMLNVLVFSSRDMRNISSSVYLLMLALSDAFYLVSVIMTKILTTLRCMYFRDSAIDIENRSTVLCKLLQYLSDLFSDLSSCLILAFTIERFVAVFMPVKMKQLCTVHRARIVCCSVLLVVAIFIAPYHIMFIGRYKERYTCVVLIDYEEMFSTLYITEAVLFRVVPVLVIAVLNASIIIRVAHLRRVKSQQKQMAASARLQSVNGHREHKRTGNDKGLQLTIMLILVSTTYIIFFIPVLVHFVMLKLWRSGTRLYSKETMEIAQNYTRTLYIVGFATNFFLYTMSGTIFREQLKAILCREYKAKKRLKTTTAETEL